MPPSKYEKFSLAISAGALVIALATPFLTYYVLDTANKDYKYRATFVRASSSGRGIETSLRTGERPLEHHAFAFANAGQRPAESMQIAVQFYDNNDTESPPIELNPPMEYSSRKSGAYHFYTVSGAVAPEARVEIIFHRKVDNLYVYTKYGDRLPLFESGFHGAGVTSD